MAHKKGVGSSDNGRDSLSKRLGVKLFGGQKAVAGNIIVRQRGTKFHAGDNVYMGRDHTLHASIDGVVVFRKSKNDRRYVSVMPATEIPVVPTEPKSKPKIKPATNVSMGTATPAPKPAAAKLAPAAPAAEVVEVTVAAATAAETPVVEVETPVVVAPAVVETPAVETPSADADWDAVSVDTPVAAAAAASGDKIQAGVFGKIAVDDLKIVEGIGPKIEQLLRDGGINTWKELSEAAVERLQEILNQAGPRFQIHNPNTWPAQAKFLVEGRWEELKEYQDMLIGGRDVKE